MMIALSPDMVNSHMLWGLPGYGYTLTFVFIESESAETVVEFFCWAIPEMKKSKKAKKNKKYFSGIIVCK